MRNEEEILSVYHIIFALINADIKIKQITEDVNQHLNIKITYRQLLYLVKRVTNITTLYSETFIMCTKRILKLYHITDVKLLR